MRSLTGKQVLDPTTSKTRICSPSFEQGRVKTPQYCLLLVPQHFQYAFLSFLGNYLWLRVSCGFDMSRKRFHFHCAEGALDLGNGLISSWAIDGPTVFLFLTRLPLMPSTNGLRRLRLCWDKIEHKSDFWDLILMQDLKYPESLIILL